MVGNAENDVIYAVPVKNSVQKFTRTVQLAAFLHRNSGFHGEEKVPKGFLLRNRGFRGETTKK